jgi:hypothetical protein
MTKQEIEARLHESRNKHRAEEAELLALLDDLNTTEQKAQAVHERMTGIALRRAKRQAAVDHFNANMRPNHEATMSEISHQLTDWRERFSQAFNHFLSVGAEYPQLEQSYDAAMRHLYADAVIGIEKDKDLIGAGWNMTDLYEVIGAISNLAGFAKPLEGLNRKAVEFAGLKIGLDSYKMQSWAYVWNDTGNQQRLQTIFDGLEIE